MAMGASSSSEEGHVFAKLDRALVTKIWPPERVILGTRVCRFLRDLLEKDGLADVVLKLKCDEWYSPGPVPVRIRPEDRILRTIKKFNRMHLRLDGAGCRNHVETVMKVVQLLPPHCQLVELELGGNRLTDAAAWNPVIRRWAATLTHLKIGANRFDTGTGMLGDALEEGCALKHIRLRWNTVGQGIGRLLDGLRKCRNLTHLDLRGNLLGNHGATLVAEALGVFSVLTHLDLRWNSICDEGFEQLAKQFSAQPKTLRHLNLSENWVGRRASELVESVAGHHSLVALNLACLGDENACWRPLVTCTRLASLNLAFSRSMVHGGPAELIEQVADMPSLRELELRRVLRARDSRMLEVLQRTQLTALDLSDNCLDGDLWAAAEALMLCTALTRLDVSQNAMGRQGAEVLHKLLGANTGLRQLRAGRCKLGSAGTGKVALALRACSSLEELDLQANDMGSHGATALGEAVCLCPRLRDVNLRGNGTRAAGLSAVVTALQQRPPQQGRRVAATVHAWGNNLGMSFFERRPPGGRWRNDMRQEQKRGDVTVIVR